jgi:methylmalonyl-CoA mutase, N-terminal domain
MDEAMAIPTAEAVRLALRTQQIIAHESEVTNTVDPAGGSYAIESLTDEMEEQATEYLNKIDAMGGMLRAIETGWVQRQIQDAAYAYQRSIETKERIVVGVNEFRMEEDVRIPIHAPNPELERDQIQALARIRRRRDQSRVTVLLDRLESAARTDENLMPHILNAVESYATVGEIADAFRKVHGEYREALVF